MRPAAEGYVARSGRSRAPASHGWRRLLGAADSLAVLPELNLLAFGSLLHLPWELWLAGSGTRGDPHLLTSGELGLALSLAALAHAGIGVAAFWFVAVGASGRTWIRAGGIETISVFVLTSLLFTLVAESLVTGVLTQWAHAALVPTFVAPGMGFPSLLQGVVTPILMAAIVRRQLGPLRGAEEEP